MRQLLQDEYVAAAAAIGDSPFTVLPAHALQRGACRAFIAGALPAFDALIIQRDGAADEPVAFGSEGATIVALLGLVAGWTSIEVATPIAPAVSALLSARLGRDTRLHDDLHYALHTPVPAFPHPAVRLLGPGDDALLAAAHPSLRPGPRDEVARLLRESVCACAIVDGQVVARADSGAWSARYADIGVITLEPYRQRGYSTAAAALVAAEIQRQGRTPVWSTGEDNWASQRVARKLGFVDVGRLTYVIASSAS